MHVQFKSILCTVSTYTGSNAIYFGNTALYSHGHTPVNAMYSVQHHPLVQYTAKFGETFSLLRNKVVLEDAPQ